MAERITGMALVLPARRNAAFLNIHTKLRTDWSPSKLGNCLHREQQSPSSQEKSRHAHHDRKNWRLVRPSIAACGASSRNGRTSRASEHGELVVRVWQRRVDGLRAADCDGNSARAGLCAFGRGSVEQPASTQPRCHSGLVHPRHAWLGLEFHGRDCSDSHGPGISLWSAQVSPRTHLDHWRLSAADDIGHGIQRAGTALRSRCILGTWHWGIHCESRSHSRSGNREVDARRTDHRRCDSIAILRPARVRNSRITDRIRVPSSVDGTEAGYQRMADAGSYCEASDLRKRIPGADKTRWCAIRSLCCLERHVLCGIRYPGGCRLCAIFRPVWADRYAGSDDHPNGSEARLLFLVALCVAVTASAVSGDTRTSDRSRGGP